jgi:predicted transcriptional regulator of viral defense system
MPKSEIQVAQINHYFRDNADRCFSRSDLENLFLISNPARNLPANMTFRAFQEMLLTETKLQEFRLRSSDYPAIRRYSWEPKASPVSVANSIMNDNWFYSHASAMWIHGLAKTHNHIFINKEQSQKPPNRNPVSQEAIDRAFQIQQRPSRLVYKYRGTTITVLSGKHTGRIAVELTKTPSGQDVHVASLERTLIDITVRPGYSGDIPAVLRAFRLARGRTQVSKRTTLPDMFDYTYPYHQAIGFYLDRAGYSDADQQLALAKGRQLDFYLGHGLKDPRFDRKWRIFFPAALR